MSTSESKSSPSFDPAPLPLPSGEYEVFLSFRGPDVRLHFADHLYTYLVGSKIRTFRDEEELPKGEFIAPSLVKAITESKVYIPIFSQNYASSKCCLQELAKMVECWRSGGGEKGQHIILPVFYFIDPRDVRHPDSGSYKEAFEQHGLNDHPPETILEWKEALQEVGKMKGWHITESDGQGAIIVEIFSKVDIHLRANYTLVTDELVGIDSQVEDVVKLLNLDSMSEKIIGIHGMGGLGKTTLAKAVYNKVSTQFERCCFLDNIRDTLSEKDGVLILQNKIISGILRKDSFKAKDVNDGIRVIQERVSRQKLLIVLDDIDERVQFEDILGKLEKFSVDSRFIVTTRDTRVLELLQGCKLFELEEMSCDHALKLFSKHAFGVNYPLEDYASLSTKFVRVATGLPLYLKVIGSLLFKRDKSFWEDKLIELKQITPTEVQERLRISYNDLTHNQMQIFLDIACIFTGVYKEGPMHMWRDCDFHPTSAISTLVQRSLVKMDQNELVKMHDHVRDLGKAIVREEHNQSPYKRSRISFGRDEIDLLEYKKGTDYVEALEVNMKGENLVLRNEHLKELSRLRYMVLRNARLSGSFKDVLPNIRWLGLANCDSVPSDLNVKKLVVLQLEDCPVRDGWKGWNEIKVSRKLKLIFLCRCLNLNLVPDLSNCGDLECLNFKECHNMRGELDISNFKNLKLLQVSDTKITKLKGEIEKLQNLQCLDASNSSLIEVPAGISKLSSLELLNLRLTPPNKLEMTSLTILQIWYCEHLPNLANLTNLLALSLWDVSIVARPNKLEMTEKLPDSLKTLTISSSSLSSLPSSLTYLKIWYCEHLPNLANLTNLWHLQLSDVSIGEILGLGELKLLEFLIIERAPNLVNLDGLESLVLLKQLRLEGCTILEKLPSLAALSSLEFLQIESCPVITEIRGAEGLWESLSNLHVRRCSRLTGIGALHCIVNLEILVLVGIGLTESVPSSLSVFTKLRMLGVSELSLEQFPDLSNLKNLRNLKIINCYRLIEVTGLDTLESLEFLSLAGSGSIKKLPDLSGLVKLKTLNFAGCTQLTEVRGLEKLELLEELDMSSCESIKELPNLSGLKKLNKLRLKGCTQLKEVKGIEELEFLQVFEADKDVSIRVLLGLGELKLLETLNIERAPNLVNLDGLESLVLLKQLSLEGCTILEKLPSLAALSSLELLEIESCSVITEIRGAGGLWESLSNLDVRGCISLEQFPDLSNLKNLKELWITYCNKLIEVTGLDTLELLEFLSLAGSGSIKKLPDLSRLVKLKKLDVEGCMLLTEIRGLEKLELLEDLDMSSCESIKELPNLSGLKKLNKLRLKGCRQLKEVKGIEELESLQVFEADKRLKVKYKLKSVSRSGKQLVTMERIILSVILAGLWGFFRLRKPTH
ncbi:Disease resistance protein L6 [Linum perenne]